MIVKYFNFLSFDNNRIDIQKPFAECYSCWNRFQNYFFFKNFSKTQCINITLQSFSG